MRHCHMPRVTSWPVTVSMCDGGRSKKRKTRTHGTSNLEAAWVLHLLALAKLACIVGKPPETKGLD